jgi:hypothetical protein
VFPSNDRDRAAVHDYIVMLVLAVFYCAGFISHGKSDSSDECSPVSLPAAAVT